jgi:hypothetical protein
MPVDPHNMNYMDFKRFAASPEFLLIPFDVRFNLVWLRLSSSDRQELIQLYRNNTEEEIIASATLQAEIHALFKEARLVNAQIEQILKVIRDFNDDSIPVWFY